ncbi:MAG: NAD(P)-dependent glycerol-1-phosphate dehydrogenase [Euryarchaeota archaeon]|nr:NAD(P)-dependent glycerol-1-phosphate dehydrogenase [Euryarchaeota archaeon]
MQLPRAVVVGEGALSQLPELVARLKLGRRCLLLTGKNTAGVAGRRAARLLEGEHEVELFQVTRASFSSVEEALELARSSGAEFLVAVGGGKVIDVAKLAAKLLGVEFISVPTAASHDGIASARASIRSEEGVASREAVAPLGVLADIEVIASAPYRLTASGCGDVLSKLTATRDWELAHRITGEEISEYSIALSRMSARIVLRSSEQIRSSREGVRRLVKALISCGVAMSIAGSSRPGSGSEHKFSHALDMIAEKPALHGEQCGVGAIMMMYLHGGDWAALREALAEIGAPTCAEELGVSGEEVVEALLKAREIRPGRYTILEHVNLDRDKAEKVARATGVV